VAPNRDKTHTHTHTHPPTHTHTWHQQAALSLILYAATSRRPACTRARSAKQRASWTCGKQMRQAAKGASVRVLLPTLQYQLHARQAVHVAEHAQPALLCPGSASVMHPAAPTSIAWMWYRRAPSRHAATMVASFSCCMSRSPATSAASRSLAILAQSLRSCSVAVHSSALAVRRLPHSTSRSPSSAC